MLTRPTSEPTVVPFPPETPSRSRACHACARGTPLPAGARAGESPRPVRPVQVSREHGRRRHVGALRVPTQSPVHEGVHAHPRGAAGHHLWEPAGEILHAGESKMMLLVMWTGVTMLKNPVNGIYHT